MPGPYQDLRNTRDTRVGERLCDQASWRFSRAAARCLPFLAELLSRSRAHVLSLPPQDPPLPVHRCQGGPRGAAADRRRDAVPGRIQGLSGLPVHACGWEAVTPGRFFSLGGARNSSRLRKFAAPARLAPNFRFLTVRPFPYRGGCPGSARPLLVPSPRRGASHAESYIPSFDAKRRVGLF